jgi:protein RecA
MAKKVKDTAAAAIAALAGEASAEVEEGEEVAESDNLAAGAGSTTVANTSSVVLPPSKRMEKLLASKAVAAISKDHGAGLLLRASDHRARATYQIPTGVFALDRALGGGWAVGRFHTVFGPKSGGKTTLLLRSIANAQRQCSNCWSFVDWSGPKPKCSCGKFREVTAGYLDVEGAYDETWAKALGIVPERLLLSQPEYAEQTLDVGEALIRSGELDILAIDSLAFLTPAKEIEESTGKDLMGVQARAIGKGIRKFVSAVNEAGNKTGRRPTIFFTNQIRMKLGVVFGNPETTPGGHAPGFSASTELRLQGGKPEMEETPKDAPVGFMARPLYDDLQFKVEKLKVGEVPHMTGSYRLILTDTEVKKKGEVYEEPMMVDLAIQYGIVTKAESYAFNGTEFGTISKLEKALMLDRSLKNEFRKALFTVLPH